ncbi:MAG: DUF4870 domain-containing protein [Mesonia sp.]|uniref:DUF4870 domain-containing protein n=2 Tax=Mesonia sp. TaxID=1960830 RepID=UPI003F9BE1E6
MKTKVKSRKISVTIDAFNRLTYRPLKSSIMEIITEKREDRQLLMLTHLSQLLDYITGIGGLIVPLIIWATQKEDVLKMNEQGKQIINFRISIFIYAILSVPLIFLFGLGFLVLTVVGIVAFVFPIINAIKANNGESTSYPLSIKFF